MKKQETRFFVLGAGGQLGSEWVRFLNENGFSFEAFTSAELDITDFSAVREKLFLSRPDVIVNCAAYTKVDQAEDEPARAYQINAEAAGMLAKNAEQLGALLVHYSTDYVFPGRDDDREKLPGGYPEDSPAEPINTYGKSKWEGEQLIRDVGSNHLILRVSWLCGAFGNNFIRTMVRLCGEQDEIRVVNDQWGSPTYTFNVVENSMVLIENQCKGTFHVTSEGLITWYDLTCEIVKMMGYSTHVFPISSEEFPTKAVRPHFSKLDTTKLSGIQGNKIIDWREGLKSLLNELNAE